VYNFLVFKQLKQTKYERFTQQLIQKAQQQPLEASFTVTMIINDTEYILKIQPERNHKVYILQALMVERDDFLQNHTLILNNSFLLSLLEILIYQGLR